MQIDPRLNEITDCLYRVAVKAIIIKGHTLLVTKEIPDEWWSLPGGGIDYHETALEALQRELEEELGLSSTDFRVISDVLFVTTGAVVDNIPKANLFYRVEVDETKVQTTPDVEAFQWVSADELRKLELSPSTGDILDKLLSYLP